MGVNSPWTHCGKGKVRFKGDEVAAINALPDLSQFQPEDQKGNGKEANGAESHKDPEEAK